MVLNI